MEIIITIFVVSAVWYFYHQYSLQKQSKEINNLSFDLNTQNIRNEYEDKNEIAKREEELKNQIFELRKQVIDVEKDSYEKGRKDAEEKFMNDFVVQVFPYKRYYKEKKDGIIAFGSIEKVEIGYQYQLFVKGLPALNPAMIVIETHELKEFKLNEEGIKALVHSAIGDKAEIAGTIIKIANNIIEKR
ncbi:hypothetical protein [Flavobacterium wongokense]|uniref:hypothetical protein n=1 Tax=Flavobacterium wongokense TaxID=2910674 RepID=UPI001F3E8DD1|nr:hypothetical protein [Flavobacterium sp. WG47]MCF6130888.1 hypothetical protein [Flavobacterium sp. WG47]